MDRFHKWCYNAVQGLGIFCLWMACGMLSNHLGFGYAPGIIIGLFVIGWAVSYKDDKEKEKRMAHIFDEDKKD